MTDFAGQTIEAARRALAARFKSAAIESAELDARILTGHALGLDLTGLITAAQRQLTPDESARLEEFARRRLAGEPVARILGEKEFWGLPLQLSSATLVPRPDTETVVELALELLRAGGDLDRPLRIADLGTGSGAILLALLSELPAAHGFGTDIREPPCKPPRPTPRARASRNARRSSPAIMRSGLSGPFDLIVSNPPYIRSADIGGLAAEVRNHDPPAALDGGADGLDAYRALIPQAAGLLAPGARPGRGGRAGSKRPNPGFDDGRGVNARDRPQGRSGGHSAGRRGPQNGPIKSYWNAKKPLGIFPGSDYVPPTTSVQGCWPRKVIAGGGQSSRSESPPSERFQNAGRIERNSWSCAALDRKANESLILRLKTYATAVTRSRHARRIGWFWQAE